MKNKNKQIHSRTPQTIHARCSEEANW